MYVSGLDPREQRYARYLLGQLPEEEERPVAEECFMNAEAFEKLETIESELCDAYVGDQLTEEERKGFETNFLCTPERVEETRFSHMLHVLRQRRDELIKE